MFVIVLSLFIGVTRSLVDLTSLHIILFFSLVSSLVLHAGNVGIGFID